MNSVEQLKNEIDKLNKKIALIQSECSHPPSARDSKPGASTGNYDPTADCYWVDHTCGLCQKKWTEGDK